MMDLAFSVSQMMCAHQCPWTSRTGGGEWWLVRLPTALTAITESHTTADGKVSAL